MKLAIAAAALAVAAIASPAFAGDKANDINWYGNVGYSSVDSSGAPTLDAANLRVGVRGSEIGLEGEASMGLTDKSSGGVKYKIQDEYAVYGVGFFPLGADTELFARVGYGHTNLKGSVGSISVTTGQDSWNVGAGAQHMWGQNGVRFDYTRFNFNNGGGTANGWGLSYVRKF